MNAIKKKKIVEFNYLHNHPQMEKASGIDPDHVIVDRKEWEEVVEYFRQYPEGANKLGVNLPLKSPIK